MEKTFSMEMNGSLSLREIKCSVSYRFKGSPGSCNFSFDAQGKRGGASADCLEAGAEFSYTGGRIYFSPAIKNISDSVISLEKMTLLINNADFKTPATGLRFYKNGYQSWSETRSFSLKEKAMVSILKPMTAMQDNLRNLPDQKAGGLSSDMYAITGDCGKSNFLLTGQLPPFKQFFYVRTSVKNGILSLELVLDFGGAELRPGQSAVCGSIIFLQGGNPAALTDEYMEMIKPEKRPLKKAPAGWCSWYYYFTKITEQAIEENLECATGMGKAWNCFVIDDGYAQAMGDWLSIDKKKFPGGLKNLAGKISSKGMTPGLWLAPFTARANSRLFREHPDWAIKDDKNRPALAGWNPNWGPGGMFYGLDTTNPGFQQHLKNVIETIVHHWGFRYLKLDFVYGASLYGKAFDMGLSPAERLELGYRIIRESAGDDVFILGCGSPLSPAIGNVDAMRIGPDVSPYWFCTYRYHLTRDPHALCTKFAIRSILNRCFMHNRLWINDPDCLLVRDTETRLSADERMSLANAIIITGNMFLLSDRLAGLSARIWEDADFIERHALVCGKGRAINADFMETDGPSAVYNTAGYLGIFNLNNSAAVPVLPAEKYFKGFISEGASLQDIRSGEILAVKEGEFSPGKLKPHSSRIFKIL